MTELDCRPWITRLLNKDDRLFRVDITVVACEDPDVATVESVLNYEGYSLLSIEIVGPGAYVFKTYKVLSAVDPLGNVTTMRRILDRTMPNGKNRISVRWTDVTLRVTDLDTEWHKVS